MTTTNELRTGLTALAKRSVGIVSACNNAESTKMYLVTPFVGLLGYDYTNPYEVYPDHLADADSGSGLCIDLAILRDGAPAIAISCQRAGVDLHDHRQSLSNYFDAVKETKLGVLTNGTLFQFFVDAARPGIMDDEPFLVVDLETTARSGVSDDIVEALSLATRWGFDAERIAELSHIQLVRKRLRTLFIEEAKAPSEAFCKFALDRIGLNNISKAVIDRYYVPIISAAYEESIVHPVIEQLKSQGAMEARVGTVSLHTLTQRIETSERELSTFSFVRRRLAYLAETDEEFEAISNVKFTDYVGRMVVYYNSERKGRLFDFIESADGNDKYIFPEPIGEVVSNDPKQIDAALKTVFATRVRELGGVAAQRPRMARSA